jgi:hypothetical protein
MEINSHTHDLRLKSKGYSRMLQSPSDDTILSYSNTGKPRDHPRDLKIVSVVDRYLGGCSSEVILCYKPESRTPIYSGPWRQVVVIQRWSLAQVQLKRI